MLDAEGMAWASSFDIRDEGAREIGMSENYPTTAGQLMRAGMSTSDPSLDDRVAELRSDLQRSADEVAAWPADKRADAEAVFLDRITTYDRHTIAAAICEVRPELQNEGLPALVGEIADSLNMDRGTSPARSALTAEDARTLRRISNQCHFQRMKDASGDIDRILSTATIAKGGE